MSKVIADTVQLGSSATATQNLVIATNKDGTFKISRGNLGATTQDILTIDGNGKFLFPQGSAARTDTISMVRLSGSPGNGSTLTNYRRFSTVERNTGADITYADSAANGASFTINTAGIYAIAYSGQSTNATHFALTKNDAAWNPSGHASSTLGMATSSATGYGAVVSWTGFLAANDVIQCISWAQPGVGGTTSGDGFTIVRIG